MAKGSMYQKVLHTSAETVPASRRDWNFYQRVANRTVELAAEDYQRALCNERACKGAAIDFDIRELERFFTGEWFKVLTDLDGPGLMKRLQEECKQYDYNYRRIVRSHVTTEGYLDDDD